MLHDSSDVRSILDNQCFAFNVWDIESAKAVVDGASDMGCPIYLQMSARVFDSIDISEFIDVIKRYINTKEIDVVLHLDHSRDMDQLIKAIDMGWDSVMFDGSHLSLSENVEMTNKISKYARDKGVMLEAEIGAIAGVEDDIESSTTEIVHIDEVSQFIAEVRVDLLAVAIGTAHGQYGTSTPKIQYELIDDIYKISEIPFVVHGGSELSHVELKRLFSHRNVKKINISTDIKQAYRNGILESLELGLLEEPGFDATKINSKIYESIKNCVIDKLKVLVNV